MHHNVDHHTYLVVTLDKYDGLHCGACFKTLTAKSSDDEKEDSDKKPCMTCEKVVKITTLDKYDGKHCGACYKKIPVSGPVTRSKSSPLTQDGRTHLYRRDHPD